MWQCGSRRPRLMSIARWGLRAPSLQQVVNRGWGIVGSYFDNPLSCSADVYHLARGQLSERAFVSQATVGAPGGTRTPNPFLRTELLFH